MRWHSITRTLRKRSVSVADSDSIDILRTDGSCEGVLLTDSSSASDTKLLAQNVAAPSDEDVQFTLMMLIHENKFDEFADVYKRYKA